MGLENDWRLGRGGGWGGILLKGDFEIDLSNEYEQLPEELGLLSSHPLVSCPPLSPPTACLSTGAVRCWFLGKLLECSLLGYLYQSMYHMELPAAFIFPSPDLNNLRVRTEQFEGEDICLRKLAFTS